MSQEGAGVAVSAEPVRNAISNLVDRGKSMITNLSSVSSSVATAAEYLSLLGDEAKMPEYRDIMIDLGKLTHEVHANQEVLAQFKESYQPSMEGTDFKVILDQALQNQLLQKPYDPLADPQIQQFNTLVGAGQENGSNAELGEDEDIMLNEGDRPWRSDKCPLSLKAVLDLVEPVKDTLGYVYEKAAVHNYLRSNPNGAKHPFAGVSAQLWMRDLSPAEEVLRAQRRRKFQKAIGADRSGDAGGEEREIIDV